MKKICVLVIFIIAAAGLMTGCAGEAQSGEKKPGEGFELSDAEENSGEEPATERLYPGLEARDFGGHEFLFLCRTINDPDWAEWNHRDLYATEENGDVINDAVYRRNKKIEEKYNIKISELVVQYPQVTTLTQKSVKAGDDTYDVIVPHIVEVAALAQGGNFLDLFKIPYLDLSKPWWNQDCIRDLSITGKLFVIQGDLFIMDNDAMTAMIFNKLLCKEYALEDPYELVKSGDWTFDKLMEMGRKVSKDLNGDGVMYIKDDLFGYVIQGGTESSFIVSGGAKIVSKDENDCPVITFGTERCYKITDYLSEMLSDTENSVNLHSYEGKFPIYDEQVKMFSEDRALFTWIRIRIVERLRGMETDFGIIPCPKLDKAQEKYITNNEPNAATGLSIPQTAGNLERTAMILEDLSAESKYTLQPAYYEINLRGKYARDDESQDMLDIILSNVAYDIGYIYNFGSFMEISCYRYGRDMKVDWVSAFEKSQGKMERDIQKMVEAYEKID